MRLINKLLKPFGVILVPRTSAKMLTESANIVETYWKSTGKGVWWMRSVAEQLAPGGDEYKVPPAKKLSGGLIEVPNGHRLGRPSDNRANKRVYRECAK